ncbi:hypothetical protein M426DRAFT_18585 [Hypoxylon sp. CI-4A]|nr:hypothetical protein M426DRAFT_18585 [Hypoxylon sp. CI-4A]
MSLSTSKIGVRFLVLLLSLLSTFTLCSADATYSAGNVTSRSELSPRVNFPLLQEFKQKVQNAEKQVGQTKEDFIDFTRPRYRSMSSDGFSGCLGVVVVTQKGAMIGHYNQDQNTIDRSERKLQRLYNANRAKLEGGQVWIYAHVNAKYPGYKNPDLVERFIDVVRRVTGREPYIEAYIEAMDPWYFDDGTPVMGVDADFENMSAGAILVENPGRGNADSMLTFMTVEMIKKSGEPYM